MGTLQEDHSTFLTIPRSVLLIMRNDAHNSCRENQNSHYFQYLFFENRAFYEIMWNNIVER